MKCSRVQDRLMDYTSAAVPPGEAQQIYEHLMGCEECRRELALARRASSALNLLGSEEPAPALVGAVREKLARDRAARRPVLVPRLALGFSAAALVAVIVTGWLRYGAVDRRNVMAVKPADSAQTQIGGRKTPERVKPSPAPVARTDEPAPVMAANDNEKPVRMSGEKIARRPTVAPKSEKRAADRTVNTDVTETPSVGPDTDSERVMLIAVRPKEPEIYVTHSDSEDGESPTELTVVREFDEGGNITSVTIESTSSEEDAGDIAPAVDRTHLLDAPPTGDREVERPHAEGSARNA